MELPNKSKAYVSLEKITDYLLSETHAWANQKQDIFVPMALIVEVQNNWHKNYWRLPKIHKWTDSREIAIWNKIHGRRCT